MKDVNHIELENIAGGNSTAAVVANSNTAESVCGRGNVKSVSDTGFVCK